MPELDIAKQDSYGYRTTGPNEPRTRVRIMAGQIIPPDVSDLEPTDDFKDQQVPEAGHAQLSAKEQEKVQEERNRQAAAKPEPLADDAPVHRGTRKQRQQRSGAIPSGEADED